MANLIIYDSSRSESRLTALIAMVKYPDATVKDFTGLALSDINTYVGTLSAATYSKIIVCVNNTRVEEVLGTMVLTITGFAATEVAYVMVDEGSGDMALGSYTSGGVSVTADAVLLAASINNGTVHHGYTAVAALGVVTVSAPVGTGALANAYAGAVDSDSGATIALTLTTDFAATATGVTAVGASGDISQAYFGDLEAKVLAAPVRDNTAQAGAAGTITLDASASAVDDYYNGMQIWLNGGTGADQVRVITDYNGTTKVATIDYNWGTNADATSEFIISEDLLEFGRDVSSVTSPKRAWNTLTGFEYDLPLVVSMFGGQLGTTKYAKWDKDVVSATTTTLTDTTEFDASAYDAPTSEVGWYVGIMSGVGMGQIRKIVSNTVSALTVTPAFTTTPTSASNYQICRGEKLALLDIYLNYIIPSKFYFTGNTFPSNVVVDFKRLVDRYGGIADGRNNLFTDDAYLEELADEGKVIVTAVANSVVS